MTTHEVEHRSRRSGWIWLLALGWLALTIAAVIWGVPHEEQHLQPQAESVLAGSGVSVDFDGRDATLTGTAASQADLDRYVATVRDGTGVRQVNVDGVTINAPAAAADPEPAAEPEPEVMASDLTGEVVDGVMTLRGEVPSVDVQAAIVAAATEQFGSDNVVDELSIAEGTEIGSFTLTGDVPSDDVRAAAGSAMEAALGAPVDNQLNVVALAAPSMTGRLDGEAVTLAGEMPSQDVIDAIVAGAVAVHGEENVTNEMTVGQVASPAYLGSLPGVFEQTSDLVGYTIDLSDDNLSVVGSGPDAETIAAAEAGIDGYGVDGLAVTTSFEIDGAGIATSLTELLQGGANFETGSAVLSAEATDKLDEAIVILEANPSTVLTVEGHTDDQGGAESNQALSEARAQAVVDYLVAGGIDSARLTAVGFGEDQPIADNDTADGRAENRRIAFVVEEGN